MPFLPTNEITTAYEVHGTGRTIVFVHGALVDRHMWQPQVEALAARYRVITYDLRGHGATGPSTAPRYTCDLLARDLRALVTVLDLEPFVVCGLSLGGMVAQAYAAAYPDDLEALVLCGTAASSMLTWGDWLHTATVGWSVAPAVRALGAAAFADLTLAATPFYRGPGWLGRDPAVRAYVAAQMRSCDTEEMAKIYDAVVRFGGVDLQRVTAPAHILNGEFETAALAVHQRHLLATLPNAPQATVPGAGHLCNLENPAAFNHTLTTFLEGALR